jgi:hypothetical protein
MKNTQNNTPKDIQKDILCLDDYQISCININKSPDSPVFSIRIDGDVLENLICIDFEDFEKMNKFFQKAMDNTINMTEYILDLKDCVIKLKKMYKNFLPVFLITINGVLKKMENFIEFDLEDFGKMNRFLKKAENQTRQ